MRPAGRWAGLWAPLQEEFGGVIVSWTRSHRGDSAEWTQEEARDILGNRHADLLAGEAARGGAPSELAVRSLAQTRAAAIADLVCLGHLLALWPQLDQWWPC